MPLDPRCQALLGELTSPDQPSFSHMTVAEARRSLAQMAALQAIGAEPVARIEDRVIPGPEPEEEAAAKSIPLRLYAPSVAGSRDGALPILLFFHGGGWTLGDLETDDPLCRSLTNRAGCLTISVGYRLAPEHRFPEPLEDCLAAARWVEEHAAAFGGDPARIAVAGESAGANLAAAVALAARDQGGPRVVHQLLICPVTDAACNTDSYRDYGEGHLLTRSDMRWFWGHYLARPEDGSHPYASPLRAPDLHGLPGATVITAECDPLRDEGEAFGARLAQAGVPARVERFPGMIHGFVNLGAMLPPGRDALELAARALREAFAAR